MDQATIDRIATETLSAIAAGRQIAPSSSRFPDFGLAGAYRAALSIHRRHLADGASAVGRKIGFTNRAIWASYDISGPIWGYLYDTTVKDVAEAGGRFGLSGLCDPRIEPEIVVHLSGSPRSDMEEDELLACIDWVAHGFEIVQSIYPGWSFQAADAVAASAVHVALLLGRRHSVVEDRRRWKDKLRTFEIEISDATGVTRSGRGSDVLGGPLQALRFLVSELERYPGDKPLAAGEVVTTGTLTEAMPAKIGQTWRTTLRGIDLEGLRLSFA